MEKRAVFPPKQTNPEKMGKFASALMDLIQTA
jgi:hypothetical protein